MSTPTQAMLNNHNLFSDQYLSSQLESFNFAPSFNMSTLPFGCNQSVKTLTGSSSPPPSLAMDDAASLNLSEVPFFKQKEEILSNFGGSQLLSLQRSSANFCYRTWGEANECMSMKRSGEEDHHHIGVSAMKMKKLKSRRKVREPRFCFKTMSDVDVLDDGYKWRKYGQKVVKNTQHPRSYYRCTQDNCRVKKRVERLAEDPRMVITTYEGRHIHSPSHDEDDLQASSQLNNLFW